MLKTICECDMCNAEKDTLETIPGALNAISGHDQNLIVRGNFYGQVPNGWNFILLPAISHLHLICSDCQKKLNYIIENGDNGILPPDEIPSNEKL